MASEHGTRGRYQTGGCRCRPCTAANTVYKSEQKEKVAKVNGWSLWKERQLNPFPGDPRRCLRCGVGLAAHSRRAMIMGCGNEKGPGGTT